MPAYAAPPRSSFWQKLGPGGAVSCLLAGVTGLGLAGLPLLWTFGEVLLCARRREEAPSDLILVLGRKLIDDAPTPVFEARLAHGESLWRAGWAPRILVAGGITGGATRSEAEAGRAWLISRGVPETAVLEEAQSQHTLENLFFVRETMRGHGWRTVLLVSDPLHMARATALAKGLGLDARRAPATGCPPRRGRPGWWKRAAFEAFLLHWYRVGLLYSRVIGSRRQLERVT